MKAWYQTIIWVGIITLICVAAYVYVSCLTPRASSRRIAERTVKRINIQITCFTVDCKRLPTQQEGLEALLEDPGVGRRWRGPYLDEDELPRDPWGNEYRYVVGRERYVIRSAGPDGALETTDDIIAEGPML